MERACPKRDMPRLNMEAVTMWSTGQGMQFARVLGLLAVAAFVMGLVVALLEETLVLETTEWFWGGIVLALSAMFFLVEVSIRQSEES